MSFLTQRLPRSLATSIPRTLTTTSIRTFTTSPALSKTATDSVKDGLKTVDRAVSDKLVDGINLTSTSALPRGPHKEFHILTEVGAAADKAKKTKDNLANSATAKQAEGKAEELKGEAKGAAGQASGMAQEMKGEAKGKAQEVKGKVKGAAEEAKQKL